MYRPPCFGLTAIVRGIPVLLIVLAFCPEARAGDADGDWSAFRSPVPRSYVSIAWDSRRHRELVFGGSGNLRLSNEFWSLAGDSWGVVATQGTPPSPRFAQSAVYDSSADRIILFGGDDGTQQLNDTWQLSFATAPPTWTALAPTGTAPSGRRAHTAVLDPVRNQMIVFGGWAGSSLGDGYVLSLADPPAWSPLTATGTPPGARDSHAAVYDPIRDRMLLYGGLSGPTQVYGQVMALSLSGTPAWTTLSPSGSPPEQRAGATMFYDNLRDRVVISAGFNYRFCPPPSCEPGGYEDYSESDTWALSLGGGPAWSQIPTTGDAPTGLGRMGVYQPDADRVVVLGDLQISALSLTSDAWTSFIPQDSPPDEFDYGALVLDPVNQRVFYFGGFFFGGHTFSYDLQAGGPWQQLAVGIPRGSFGHSMIYDPLRRRIVMFGGVQGTSARTYFNDAWELPLDPLGTWTQIVPAGTPPAIRAFASAIYDPAGDRMIVFGGFGSVAYNDAWALEFTPMPTWVQLAPSGGPPSPRLAHSAVLDAPHQRMIVFGGRAWEDDNLCYCFPNSEVWSLALDSDPPLWTNLTPTGSAPSPRWRSEQSAVFDPLRGRMVIFGGLVFSQQGRPDVRTNEAWSLSLGDTPAWSQLSPGGLGPGDGTGQVAVGDPLHDRMLVYGGNALVYELLSLQWSGFADVPAPAPIAKAVISAVSPNPARSMLSVALELPTATNLRLELLDIAGRRVQAQSMAGLGAGRHVVTLGFEHNLRPGVYLVRLGSSTRRFAVVR